MKLIKYLILGCLLHLHTGLHAQTQLLKTLEQEQVYVQMAVSIQEQVIRCFDEKLQPSFRSSFRINQVFLHSSLRSDSIPGFDITAHIDPDERAPLETLNPGTVQFGKLTVTFTEWYLNKHPEIKGRIMAVFEREKERFENGYYVNKLPKKPSFIYDHWAHAQLIEGVFDDLLALDMGRYGIRISPTDIYLDVHKDRFIMATQWMDKRARTTSKHYELGNLSMMFEDDPGNVNNTLDELLKIDLATSGDSKVEIKQEIQQIIDRQKQAFLERNKR